MEERAFAQPLICGKEALLREDTPDGDRGSLDLLDLCFSQELFTKINVDEYPEESVPETWL